MASSIHLGDDEIRPLPLHAGESVISRDIELAVRKQDTDEMPIETPQHKTPTQSFDTSGILQESPKVRGKLRTFTVMASLCCTLFIAALNSTTVATAVPTISAELHGASGYAWISAAYLLANATTAPVWAKLSDIWGRKPILLTAVTWYFFASIICATAQSMGILIFGRTLQGMAGGGLIQLVYIVISDLFSMRSRTIYLGLLQLMWAVAGGTGPVLGGLLTEYVSWRWIFWINLPIAGTTFLLLSLFLDVHNPRTKFIDGIKAVDWFGSISIIGVMGMLMVGLNFGGATFPWNSPKVICLLIFGAVMLIVFIVSEKKLAAHPLMPLGLFRSKSNVAVLVVGFTHDFALFATEFYLPLYFQSVKGASPLRSGSLILPATLTEACVGMITGVIVHQTGKYVMIIYLGVIILTLGNGLYINLNTSSSIGQIIAFEIVAAIGTGLLFQPPLIALQAQVSPKDTATATATLGFVRNLATSLSIIIGGLVFQNGIDSKATILKDSGLSSNLTSLLTGPAAASNVMLISSIPEPERMVVKQAFSESLNNIWVLCTAMAGCAIVASWFITGKKLSRVHTEARTGLEKDEPVAVVIGGDESPTAAWLIG